MFPLTFVAKTQCLSLRTSRRDSRGQRPADGLLCLGVGAGALLPHADTVRGGLGQSELKRRHPAARGGLRPGRRAGCGVAGARAQRGGRGGETARQPAPTDPRPVRHRILESALCVPLPFVGGFKTKAPPLPCGPEGSRSNRAGCSGVLAWPLRGRVHRRGSTAQSRSRSAGRS